MKYQVKIKELHDFMSVVEPIVKKASQDMIYFKVDQVFVASGDMKVSIRMDSGITCGISFSQLKKFISSLDKEDVIIFQEHNEAFQKYITVKLDGKLVFRINDTVNKNTFLNKLDLKEDMIRTAHGMIGPMDIMLMANAEQFTSNDELRPVLCCVAFDHNRIVSTNATMMSFENSSSTLEGVRYTKKECIFKEQLITEIDDPILFPKDVLRVLKKYKNLDYVVSSGMKLAKFDEGENETQRLDRMIVVLKSYLIEISYEGICERFPNWKSVVPNFPEPYIPSVTVFMDRSKALKGVKIAKTVDSGYVALNLSKEGEVSFEGECMDSRTQAKLDVTLIDTEKYVHEANELELDYIAFDPDKLIKLLLGSKNKEVSMTIFGQTRACIIDGKYLLMPKEIREPNYK
jgi:hypothetical protein